MDLDLEQAPMAGMTGGALHCQPAEVGSQGGQILISPQVMSRGVRIVSSESVGELNLKGLPAPVPTSNVMGLQEDLRSHNGHSHHDTW